MAYNPPWEGEVSWENQDFKDWLAGYYTLYDPNTFIEELSPKQHANGAPQDLIRYPTHEKGVMAVRMFNDKLDNFHTKGPAGRALAYDIFAEIFRNAGVPEEDEPAIKLIFEAACENGYLDNNSTRARW